METCMNKFKSFTSIEQSKKLAEILPLESTDMRYGYIAPYEFSDRMYEGGYDDVPYPKDFMKRNPNFSENEYDGEFPCWSLASLLGVLPSATLDSSNDHYYRLHCMERFTEWYDNPIDACYEMILKLHEQKIL